MPFSLGIIELFGILTPGVLVVGNVVVLWSAASVMWNLGFFTDTPSTMVTTLLAVWLAAISFAVGMCLRMFSPRSAERLLLKGTHRSDWDTILDDWLGWTRPGAATENSVDAQTTAQGAWEQPEGFGLPDFDKDPKKKLWTEYFLCRGEHNWEGTKFGRRDRTGRERWKNNAEREQWSKIRRLGLAKAIVVERSERLGRYLFLAEGLTRCVAGMLWGALLGVALCLCTLVTAYAASKLSHVTVVSHVVLLLVLNLALLVGSCLGIGHIRAHEAGWILGSFLAIQRAERAQPRTAPEEHSSTQAGE